MDNLSDKLDVLLLRVQPHSQALHGHERRPKWLRTQLYNELINLDDGALDHYAHLRTWSRIVLLALDGMSREIAFNEKDGRRMGPVHTALYVCTELSAAMSRKEMENPTPVAKTKQGKRRATRTAKTK